MSSDFFKLQLNHLLLITSIYYFSNGTTANLEFIVPKTQILKKSWLISGNNEFLFHQVTFLVTHFNDPRISSAALKDLLLQSISVLVQDREFLAAFECNEAARQRMPKALLSAFDNRSWIPVTNILLRLCKGSGFGFSKRGESSSSSVLFQVTMVFFYFCTEGVFANTYRND